jgi:poly(3-hydroxybutyrate) depolymerase
VPPPQTPSSANGSAASQSASAGTGPRCAVARSILVIVWHLLADPTSRYHDLGPGWHTRKADTDRRTRSLLNQLRALHPEAEITVNPTAA